MKRSVIKPTELGQGVNSVTQEAKVTYPIAPKVEQTGSGAENDYLLKLCLSAQELSSAVGGSVSLDLGIGPFGFNASASGSSKVDRSEFAAYLVVRTFCKQGKDIIKNPRLKDDIEVPGNEQEAEDFFKVYGDSYVASISKGIGFYAIYSFKCKNEAQRSSVEAAFGANGIIKMVTFDLATEAKMKEAFSRIDVEWVVEHNVLGVKGMNFPPDQNVIDFAKNFPENSRKHKQSPIVLNWVLNNYETLPEFITSSARKHFKTIFENRNNILDRKREFDKVNILNRQLNRLKEIYKTYKSHQYCDGYVDNLVIARDRDVKKEVEAINKLVQSFNRKPATPIPDFKFDSINHGYPKLRLIPAYPGSLGPSQGGSVVDPSQLCNGHDNFIAQQYRVSAIKLETQKGGMFESDLISRLEVEYTSMTNEKNKIFPVTGAGMTLSSSDFITEISGKCGGWIDKLFFRSKDGQILVRGGDGGSDFRVPIAPNQFLLYIIIKQGGVLDNFRVVLGHFEDALFSEDNWPV